MKNEGDVKKVVKDVLKSTKNCWWFMPPANGFGRAGIPDFVGIVNGLGFAIETKFGKGTTTANQNREIEAVSQSGGEVWIVRETNVDEWASTFKAWAALNARNS
jgi:hypothetical protein